ncbi:MAG: hypothetical protein DHS80DRAFT_6351, partial [Piptocephalis tieghemiana]
LFRPRFIQGHWRDPKVSLRRQADIRKTCLILGVDPVSIGLPEKKEKGTLRKKPFKLHKSERTFSERRAKVAKAMEEMPSRVEQWRREYREEREKSKSVLPF